VFGAVATLEFTSLLGAPVTNCVRVLTRQPLKNKESREIDRGLLEGLLLLQTVYPAGCNMGGEKRVADGANALREAEQKQVRKRKYHQEMTKSINPE